MLTLEEADSLVRQLHLDDFVEEHETQDEDHVYHLGSGLHLRIGSDGSIKLVDDEGISVDLNEEGYAEERHSTG